MAALDTFSEVSLLSITRKDGTDRDFSAIIESWSVSGGEKGFESIPTISGGRLKKFTPQEDVEVTIEGYATELATDSGASGLGWFDLMHSEDTSQPISISVDRTHDEFRLVIMNTDNASQSAATAVTTTGDKAIKMSFQNGHFTNVETDFGDKVVKFSVTFKCPVFNSAGTANVTYESTDGTATKVIPASSSYTS